MNPSSSLAQSDEISYGRLSNGFEFELRSEDSDGDFASFTAASGDEPPNESDASGRRPLRKTKVIEEASAYDNVLVVTTNEQLSDGTLGHGQLTPGKQASAKALAYEAVSREHSPVEDPATRTRFTLGKHYEIVTEVRGVDEKAQRPPEIHLSKLANNIEGNADGQSLIQAKATISDHEDQSGRATHPLHISSSPSPTSIDLSSVTCTKEGLEGTRDPLIDMVHL
ncbi:hypothetical protein CC78DRAFT_580499 [Lojkania enalia]|uniref:Uncharacterized protein n=1 Tax=Lojkania enalia TaxID=147567 RepID=A0A9P4K9X5_9PLEO|nr:hypothetical protein CC78DRAFT_580499 [Didymosphaeria enalia]